MRPKGRQGTRREQGRWVVLMVGMVLGALLATCGAPELTPGQTYEGELDPEEGVTFRMALEAGRLYRLTVGEVSGDLAVTLEGPEDSLPLGFDTRRIWPTLGDEVVEIVPRQGGSFRASIKAASGSAESYRLRFEDLGEADLPARSRIEADWTFAIAEGHRRADEPVAAREAFGRALERYRGLGDAAGEGRVHERLARVADGTGSERLAALTRAAEIYRASGQSADLARVLWSVGDTQRRVGNSNEALATFEELLELARRAEEPYWTGIALGHLGRLHRRVGSFGRAETLHREALEIWHGIEHPAQEGVALGALGQTALALGDASVARDRFAEAVSLFETLGSARSAARAQIGLGTALQRVGKLAKAESALRDALAETQRLGDRAGEAAARNNLSNVLYHLGRFDEAGEQLEMAQETYSELGNGRGLTTTFNGLGRIYDAQGYSDLAAQHYDEALARSQARGDRSNQASALRGLARLERRLGQLDTARATLESALAVIEGLRIETADAQSRALYLAHRHGYFRELVGILMELHRERPEEGFVALALAAAERSRARGLREILLASRWGMEATEEQRTERRRWIEEHHRIRNDLETSGAAQRRELLRQLEVVETGLASLDEVVMHSDPRTRRLLDPPELDLATLIHGLPAGQQILFFSLGEPSSHAFLIAEDGIETFELPGEEEVERVARSARRSLGEDGFSTHARLSAERDLAVLGDRLLSPLVEHLRGGRLVVIADGVLQYLPFAALPDPRDGRPLVEDFEIVRWASLATGKLLSGADWPGVEGVAIVADPIFDCSDPRVEANCPASRYPRLRSARRWLEAMGELTRSTSSLFLVGAEARYDLLAATPFSEYGVLHLYTHGEIDDRAPELSHLVLTQIDPSGSPLDRRFLTFHDIRGLDLQSELVVLGACDTALGQEIRGEGLLGLTHAFFQAGARRVVASLWSVRDSATAELMIHFDRALLEEGLAPSAALRRAQLALLADEETKAPYFWAGFELHGPVG